MCPATPLGPQQLMVTQRQQAEKTLVLGALRAAGHCENVAPVAHACKSKSATAVLCNVITSVSGPGDGGA